MVISLQLRRIPLKREDKSIICQFSHTHHCKSVLSQETLYEIPQIALVPAYRRHALRL